MSDLDAIGGLQVVIILLLLHPQKRRRNALLTMAICVGIGAALWYIALPAVVILFGVTKPVIEKFGWIHSFTLLALLGLGVALLMGYRVDYKKNRAIRAGSKEAFDERVRTYMHVLNYSEEDAIAATTRIRDGKRK
jgi:MFS family permease